LNSILDNRISQSGAKAIASILEQNHPVTSLNLSGIFFFFFLRTQNF